MHWASCTEHCVVSTKRCALSTRCSAFHTGYHSLCIEHRNTVHWVLPIVHCALSITQRALGIMH